MKPRISVVGLYQRVAKGELTPEEAAILAEFGNLRFEKMKFIVSMLAVFLVLGWIWLTAPGTSLDEVAPLRQQLGACLSKKQIYVQCTAVDSTHDLCERLKK